MCIGCEESFAGLVGGLFSVAAYLFFLSGQLFSAILSWVVNLFLGLTKKHNV